MVDAETPKHGMQNETPIEVERDTYPASPPANLQFIPQGPVPVPAYDVEDECHVELVIRIGGGQLILRREWQNEQAFHDEGKRALVEAHNMVQLANVYVDTPAEDVTAGS